MLSVPVVVVIVVAVAIAVAYVVVVTIVVAIVVAVTFPSPLPCLFDCCISAAAAVVVVVISLPAPLLCADMSQFTRADMTPNDVRRANMVCVVSATWRRHVGMSVVLGGENPLHNADISSQDQDR
jgi:hypothetical protein